MHWDQISGPQSRYANNVEEGEAWCFANQMLSIAHNEYAKLHVMQDQNQVASEERQRHDGTYHNF